jgi:EmrB/QacA subfamily drug resistance transporter
MGTVRPPCDEAVVRSGHTDTSCSGTLQFWILAATIFGSSMAFIDGTVVNVALPALQASFHATVVDVQWVVESYGLFMGALILVGGSLGDLFGRRRMFVLGVIAFTAASVACGLAHNVHQLVIARSIQGIGAAFLVPGSLAIIGASFEENTRGRAIGTWSGFTSITTALGPVLGGWLIEHASWRWAFFLNLPLAVAVIAISLWKVPESRGTSAGRIDWRGALLVTVGLGGLVNGLIESVNLGWRHPLVFGSLMVGAICLIVFCLVEAQANFPMVPLKLFASRSFSGANLLTLFLYAALSIFFFVFPMNLIQVQGYSATAAGAATLPLILLLFALSRWSGGLVDRYGPRTPLLSGPLLAALGFALFALPSTGGNYWKTFFPALVVLGIGMAITVAPLTTVVMSSVAPDRVGTASGINNAVSRIAGVLAIAVLGIVMVHTFRSRLGSSFQHLALPSHIRQEIQADETKLAGLAIPDGIDAETKTALKHAVNDAFVFGFRVVVLLCAGLVLASSGVAYLLIERSTKRSNQQ